MAIELTVTPVLGDRVRTMTGQSPLDGLLDLAHRMACEAAQLHQMQHPKSVEFMEAETGRKGWRAYMSRETARAVEALEDTGAFCFVHVDDA